jgi:hypothetical protein
MSRWPWFILAFCGAFMLAGCARPAPRSNVALSVKNTAPAAKGTPSTSTAIKVPQPPPETLPPPPPIAYTKDNPGVISGQVLAAEGRGVVDAVAFLEKGTQAATSPGAELQLIQKEGEFRPRIQTGRKGSQLKLLCADEKASFKATGAGDFNIRLTQGKHMLQPLERVGLLEVRSELKPEQLAYVWVFDHPYFALTDSTGRFRLPTVAPGDYTLVFWYAGKEPQRKQMRLSLQEGWGAEVDWQLPD